jgi:hypothetical protein
MPITLVNPEMRFSSRLALPPYVNETTDHGFVVGRLEDMIEAHRAAEDVP